MKWTTLYRISSLFSLNGGRPKESKESFFVNLGNDIERSTSRGRSDLQSTGRGGYGNFRATSKSRDRVGGPDDFSPTRGREPQTRSNVDNVYSSGRGGSGNIRSPSRGAPLVPDTTKASDNVIIREHLKAEEGHLQSSGRGGSGNINRSRSREPNNDSSSTLYHSTGRGGVGNIHHGGPISEAVDEEERLKECHGCHDHGLHSTGRGGLANLTAGHVPEVEHHKHKAHDLESTGRGGAGNIIVTHDQWSTFYFLQFLSGPAIWSPT